MFLPEFRYFIQIHFILQLSAIPKIIIFQADYIFFLVNVKIDLRFELWLFWLLDHWFLCVIIEIRQCKFKTFRFPCFAGPTKCREFVRESIDGQRATGDSAGKNAPSRCAEHGDASSGLSAFICCVWQSPEWYNVPNIYFFPSRTVEVSLKWRENNLGSQGSCSASCPYRQCPRCQLNSLLYVRLYLFCFALRTTKTILQPRFFLNLS